LEINAFHSVADAGQHLVRDGVENIAQNGDWEILAENLNLITLLTRDVGDIDKGDIHTDITYILGLLTVDEAIAMAVAQVAVQTVGIADRNSSNDRVALKLALAAVAHRLALGHIAHLEDGGLQGADGMEDAVIAGIDTIEAQSQTTHVELAIGEVLDAGRIVDMAQNLM